MQSHVALFDGDRRPRLDRFRIAEPSLLEGLRRLRVRDDGNRLVQIALSHLIEVIAMEVPQHNQIQRRQCSDLHGGIDQPRTVHAVANRDLLMAMNEGRVCENGHASVLDQHGGIADKFDRALIHDRAAILYRQYQTCIGVH